VASLYLRRTLTGFAPADEPSAEIARKFKVGETYRAEVKKPRSYRHHCLIFALLSLTYENLPEGLEGRYASFDQFRQAVAIAAGHVQELITLDGEILLQPKSVAYDSLDQAAFEKVAAAMMSVCAKILDVSEPELAGEVSRYADATYGAVAA